ncbi:MAG: hypothetical protein IKF91_02830 [Bacilli bacterium]|nr:hypothetical protein [Bacilli bacterium]
MKKRLAIIIICVIIIITCIITIFRTLNGMHFKYIERGVKIVNSNIYQLNLAIEDENEQEIKKMIKKINLNKLPFFYEQNVIEETKEQYMNISPLSTACWMGNYKIVHLLIENGADVNYRGNSYNYYPIEHALIYYGMTEDRYKIAKLLLEKGSKINVQSSNQNLLVSFLMTNYIENDKLYSKQAKLCLKTIKLFINKYSYSTDELNTILVASVKSNNYIVTKYLIENSISYANNQLKLKELLLEIAKSSENKVMIDYLQSK